MSFQSIFNNGFLTPETLKKFRGLLIGTEGLSDSGKTEFALSSPGPIAAIGLDRNYGPVFLNDTPPATRTKLIGFKPITIPLAGTTDDQEVYKTAWKGVRNDLYEILKNPGVRTCLFDGDSDSWELQRLAAFGKLTKVPSIMYDDINTARKAFISRMNDSGKIVIATNKVKAIYEDKVDNKGNTVLKKGSDEAIQVKSGEYYAAGYSDHDYLWHIWLRHLVEKGGTKVIQKGPREGEKIQVAPRYGIRIIKCKPKMILEGSELWDEHCNMQSLLKMVFPLIPLSEWGY